MTPTPEQKSKELVLKFRPYAINLDPIGLPNDIAQRSNAKECAKICCQEIINALPKLVAGDGYGRARFVNPDIEFYTNVLKAIDTL